MPKIILSYRRSDSAGLTGRMFDNLVSHYGKEAVYMDIAPASHSSQQAP